MRYTEEDKNRYIELFEYKNNGTKVTTKKFGVKSVYIISLDTFINKFRKDDFRLFLFEDIMIENGYSNGTESLHNFVSREFSQEAAEFIRYLISKKTPEEIRLDKEIGLYMERTAIKEPLEHLIGEIIDIMDLLENHISWGSFVERYTKDIYNPYIKFIDKDKPTEMEIKQFSRLISKAEVFKLEIQGLLN